MTNDTNNDSDAQQKDINNDSEVQQKDINNDLEAQQQDTKPKVRTQWHPGFCGAIRLEFAKYLDNLFFDEENIVKSAPIKADMMIRKDNADLLFDNEIGCIFRKYNLFEYKSPYASLGINTFSKTLGYAYFFKVNERGTEHIDFDEISITFIRCRKPVKLLNNLKKRGFKVEKRFDGIYYISGDVGLIHFIQVVVTSELNENNHRWLTSLQNRLTEEQFDKITKDVKRLKKEINGRYISTVTSDIDRMMQVIIKANNNLFRKDMKGDMVMCEAFFDLFKDEIDERIRKAVAEKDIKIAEKDSKIAEITAEKDSIISKLQQEIASLKKTHGYSKT